MEKEFEKWLKRNELFEYYIANPKQQEDIYKDYQREKEYFKHENIDEWVKWLCNNPELAEKHYPLLVNSLKERIQNTEPFLTANIIQNLPEQFTIWKTEINNHSGNYREKKIKEQITLLNGVLNEWEYPTEIERQAVVSVRPYLIEQLKFWKRELQLNTETLPPQPIIESPFSVLEWATIFYYADETKLLTESRLIKTRLEQFMSKHQINTTFDNFKTKYYEAKKRINEKNDYPINKLELIIPFLKENYKQTVTKVENDIIFLKENKPEY